MTYFWVLSGRVGAAFMQALGLIFLARWSLPAEFGLVVGVQGVLFIVSAICGFGFGPYITLERANNRTGGRVELVISLNSISSVLLGSILLVIFVIIGLIDTRFLLLVPLALAQVPQRDSAVWQGLAVADGNIKLFSTNLLLRRFCALAFFLLLHVFEFGSILAYGISVLLAELIANMVLKSSISNVDRVKANLKDFRHVVSRSRSYWAETVFAQVRNLDVAIVGLAAGPVISGIYAVPARLSSAVNLVPSSIATIILPRVRDSTRKSLNKIIFMSIAVFFSIGIFLLLLSPFLEFFIRAFLGEQYLNAVLPTKIYFIGLTLLSGITLLNVLLQGMGLAGSVAWATFVGGLLLLVGVYIGAVFGDSVGASIGYSIALLFQFLIMAVISGPKFYRFLKKRA